jgi:hypothetical protein
MIDTESLQKLIESQVAASVNDEVHRVVADQDWISAMESRIIQHIQDRITAKFNHISSVPDLVDTVKDSVKDLVAQGHLPDLDQYVDRGSMQQAIDSTVQQMIKDTIDNLILDQGWLQKIEMLVTQSFSQKISTELSRIDVNQLIVDNLKSVMDVWYERIRNDFRTAGITDSATDTQLCITDQKVEINHALSAQDLEIIRDATVDGTLKVSNLAVTGSINIDNNSWHELTNVVTDNALTRIDQDFQDQLLQKVLDQARTSGIDFASVSIGGQSLISGTSLCPLVDQIGPLKQLTVTGETNIFDTLSIGKKRVGINTKHPEMALAIWDEEINIVAGKIEQDTAYLGTGRKQNLIIGTNQKNHVMIDSDGMTTVKKLRVDRWCISHSATVPGWSGTRGDLVLNNDPKPDQPFAWICLGAFRWQSLRAA